MRASKNKLIKKAESYSRFAISPIFLPWMLIAIAASIFYFLATYQYFPAWISKIYIALKIFILLEIILGSAKTIIMPLSTLISAFILLYVDEVYKISFLSTPDIRQLIFASLFGFFISLLIKW